MEDEGWYWGSTDRSFVDTYLSKEEDGSFLVFLDSQTGCRVLAYRRDHRNIYKNILFRDHYYGFTEPLGFESLSELLNAYNWSPTTEASLTVPLRPPSAIGERPTDAVSLLIQIDRKAKEISIRQQEMEVVVEKKRQLESDIQEIQKNIDGLKKVCRLTDNQIQRHNELSRRMSDSTIWSGSTILSDNYSLLLDRQRKAKASLSDKESLMSQQMEKIFNLQERYNTCMFAVSSLQEDQEEEMRVLLRYYPQLAEYVDYLVSEIAKNLPSPFIHDIRTEEAERLLNGQPTGTFLIRISRKYHNIPYGLCVCFDRRVVHFPVYKTGEFYGFDESLCIFENLQDLTSRYTVLPFCFHGEQYGRLILIAEFGY